MLLKPISNVSFMTPAFNSIPMTYMDSNVGYAKNKNKINNLYGINILF